ncbi:unnamed protein product, partial [Toxocara canis]|uniref:DUF4071 domain-containing protein n=1 Tax=Toxocara canis TaxID=6265 RepID=A0A183UL34_TOXCA
FFLQKHRKYTGNAKEFLLIVTYIEWHTSSAPVQLNTLLDVACLIDALKRTDEARVLHTSFMASDLDDVQRDLCLARKRLISFTTSSSTRR